jgi:hypothetical protein
MAQVWNDTLWQSWWRKRIVGLAEWRVGGRWQGWRTSTGGSREEVGADCARSRVGSLGKDWTKWFLGALIPPSFDDILKSHPDTVIKRLRTCFHLRVVLEEERQPGCHGTSDLEMSLGPDPAKCPTAVLEKRSLLDWTCLSQTDWGKISPYK